MTTIQQGWIFCADGFNWLQRLTAAGLLDPDSLRVDASQLSDSNSLPESWHQYANEDGWYTAVPVALVNELVAQHGGVVDAMSSHIHLRSDPDEQS